MTTLYFAYGSNLNTADRTRWLLDRGYPADCLRPVGPAQLADHQLCYDYHSPSRRGGALNLRPRLGSLVHGMLFEATEIGWHALDAKEGVAGRFYERIPVHVTRNGQLLRAVTYWACAERRRGSVRPTQDYVRLVREGCREHGIPYVCPTSRRPNPTDAVFVYGTLMRGEPRSHVLQELRCCILGRMPGRLFDLGSFPGARPDTSLERHRGSGQEWVEGEYIRVGDVAGTLELLDSMEGYRGSGRAGSLFRRELVTVDVGDRLRSAWTYFYAGEPSDEVRRITSGCWRTHQGTREAFLQELVASHCPDGEEPMIRALAKAGPFPLLPSFVTTLRPIWKAVNRWDISERELAQVSGNWSAGCDRFR